MSDVPAKMIIQMKMPPLKQDGNHEPESLHVLRRWIDHNKMTVH